jgi:hypothetical protein
MIRPDPHGGIKDLWPDGEITGGSEMIVAGCPRSK